MNRVFFFVACVIRSKKWQMMRNVVRWTDRSDLLSMIICLFRSIHQDLVSWTKSMNVSIRGIYNPRIANDRIWSRMVNTSFLSSPNYLECFSPPAVCNPLHWQHDFFCLLFVVCIDQRWRHDFLEDKGYVRISKDGLRATFVKSKSQVTHTLPFSFAFGFFTIGDGASTSCKIRLSYNGPIYFGLVRIPLVVLSADLDHERAQWMEMRSLPASKTSCVFEIRLDIDTRRMDFFANKKPYHPESKSIKLGMLPIDDLVPFVALGHCDSNHLPFYIDFVK